MHATHWLVAETLWEVSAVLEPLPEVSTYRPVRVVLVMPVSTQEHAAL